MTVCRFFAKGYCRYGDQCRFEHVQTNDYYHYNQRNGGSYQDRYSRQENEYSNYYRNDNVQRNQRYESRNYHHEDQRGYSPDRYEENYQYQPSSRYGYYDNQHQNRYKKDYDDHNYRKNQQYSNYQDNQTVKTQNRFQWLSDDYRNQNRENVDFREKKSQNSYQTSTPKGKVEFSFRVPESELQEVNNTIVNINEQDQLHAEVVKEDAKSWELGGQWPFTCYFPSNGKHAFPGFYDVSPEELRYAAYRSRENNSYESYVQAVQNSLEQVNQQRSQLHVITPDLLSTLKRIRNGEDLYSASRKINPISSSSTNAAVESMEVAAFSIPASNSAAFFSFKTPTETDSSAKTSVTNFSFKLPAGTEIKPVPPSIASDGDVNIYTPMGSLTSEEKEQFSASTFMLGKIPTRPPPQGLCT